MGETIEIISIALFYSSVHFLTKLNKFQCKALTLFISHKIALYQCDVSYFEKKVCALIFDILVRRLF